jgi:hypothetical protein
MIFYCPLLSYEARDHAAVRQARDHRPCGSALDGLADPVGATRHQKAQPVETVAARPAGEPIMAIVSLSNQQVTIYDADGWILRAPVSSGQTGMKRCRRPK